MLKLVYGIRLILQLNLCFKVNGGTVMYYNLLRISLTLWAIQLVFFFLLVYNCAIFTVLLQLNVMASVKLFIESETCAIFYSYSSSKVSVHYSWWLPFSFFSGNHHCLGTSCSVCIMQCWSSSRSCSFQQGLWVKDFTNLLGQMSYIASLVWLVCNRSPTISMVLCYPLMFALDPDTLNKHFSDVIGLGSQKVACDRGLPTLLPHRGSYAACNSLWLWPSPSCYPI